MSRADRSAARSSARAVLVAATNRRDVADREVDFAASVTPSPNGSSVRACRLVATPASIFSMTTAVSWSSAAKAT